MLPVFADSYAAVPHLSLARVIAMFDAGVLGLTASGDDAEFRNTANGGVEISWEGNSMTFDALIDARGQASATLDQLPFPSLVKTLSPDQHHLETPFRLVTSSAAPIYCLALPQLLERYPFAQGLANSADNAKTIAADILDRLCHHQ